MERLLILSNLGSSHNNDLMQQDTQSITNYIAKLDELKAKTATMSGTFHKASLESMAFKATMQDSSEEAQTFVQGLQNGTERLN